MKPSFTINDLSKYDIIRDTELHEGNWEKLHVYGINDEGVWLWPHNIIAVSFNLTTDELHKRIESGRYEPLEIAAFKPDLGEIQLPFDRDTPVYIRFGDLPENETSTNFIDGSKEQGVSVYAAEIDHAPNDADYSKFSTPPEAMFVPYGPKIQQVLFLMFRKKYLVTGDEVGTGNDGEPLLKNIEIIGRLSSPAGVDGFVLGRDDFGPYDPTEDTG